jgi:hypothetical protein
MSSALSAAIGSLFVVAARRPAFAPFEGPFVVAFFFDADRLDFVGMDPLAANRKS